jgi:hypothetical protein
MATKPNVYPEFSTSIDDDGVGTITNPTSGQKNAQPPSVVGYSTTEGFQLQQFVPRQILNHLFGLADRWFKWLDELTDSNEVRITTQEANHSTGNCVLKLYLESAPSIESDVTVYWSRSGGAVTFRLPKISLPSTTPGGTNIALDYVSGDRPPQPVEGEASSTVSIKRGANDVDTGIYWGDSATANRMFLLAYYSTGSLSNLFGYQQDESFNTGTVSVTYLTE